MDKITALFEEALKDSGVSKITLKNYRSDINDFKNWAIDKIKSTGAMPENLQEAVPFIKSDTANQYKAYLTKKGSEKTTNRRLSTLRKFAHFLYHGSYLDFNFTDSLKNSNQENRKPNIYLGRFEKYLTRQKISKNTIKNYMSDIRQFEAYMHSEKSN